jgi:glycosyltransferase involved in cell wall biosynthesis
MLQAPAMSETTDVVVPIYNEEWAIDELLAHLRRACPQARLIFVDNGSSDGTAQRLARESGVTLVRHERNLGYGRSLLDGIRAGTGDRIAMIDADLEYHPEDLPALLAALDTAPAVYGSRLLEARGRELMPALRAAGNTLVTALFNLLFRQRLTDLYTGIRAVRRSALPAVELRQPGFEFVLELAARLARAGTTIAEVPVGYTPRSTGVSKMRHVPEFLKFALHLLRLRFGDW